MLNLKQSGSALIICMVFLLLLTVLGLSSMQSSTMQEKMVGNAVEENRAFQQAEGALRAGEKAVEDNKAAFDSSTADASFPEVGSTPSGSGWEGASAEDAYFHVQKISYANSVYRITAIGYGIDDNARVVLQSTYRPK